MKTSQKVEMIIFIFLSSLLAEAFTAVPFFQSEQLNLIKYAAHIDDANTDKSYFRSDKSSVKGYFCFV